MMKFVKTPKVVSSMAFLLGFRAMVGMVGRIFWIWIRRVRYFRYGYAECTWVGVMVGQSIY
jgi:hypothetical protein